MLHRVLSILLCCGGLALSAPCPAEESFVNWETPTVHPLDRTPDGARLLSVNLADARLDVWDVTADGITHTASIPVGLDPVSVRARTSDEAWVVNHISDSVSIVSLATGHVIATLTTEDEPCDVVFAGDPERAFVTCSQTNHVLVFDPADLAAAPSVIEIRGEDPRALAVSADKKTVYAAVFESGNGTTIVDLNAAILPTGPYNGANPPPNDGTAFSPPKRVGNPAPPAVSHIVRKNAEGIWLDDNGGDWTELVSGKSAALSGRVEGWDLIDHDLAMIDTETLSVSYADRCMQACMALAVNPADGRVAVVGTAAMNEVRFEPNLRGRFLRVEMALVDPAEPAAPAIIDLNPHLDYASSTIAQVERNKSIGDPRAIVWTSDGETAYVAGMGSNNVIVIDDAGTRLVENATGSIAVGEGPVGLVLDDDNDRLYVLNRFEASISIVDTTTSTEIGRISYFDSTPGAIRAGRRHQYNTHETSGLGHTACGSCHLDSRTDRLAWDLGDPAGEMKDMNANCMGVVSPELCRDWHPMKGPMVTQTLQDIIGKEPFHWRGDRESIEAFNPTFETLQGDDEQLTGDEMAEYKSFLASIHFPPNPYRNFDNSLPDDISLAGHFTEGRFGPAGEPLPNGDAVAGFSAFEVACIDCHGLPTGLGFDSVFVGLSDILEPIPAGPDGEHHHMLFMPNTKIMSLRGLYDRVGLELTQSESLAGFGFRHDGTAHSLAEEVSRGLFIDSDQTIVDVVAFLLAFNGSELVPATFVDPVTPSQDTHAAVGAQVTFNATTSGDKALAERAGDMRALADENRVGLVAHARVDDEARGYRYTAGGDFQSDRAAETVTWDDLLALAGAGSEVTLTVVPLGAETRLGIDRDRDGAYDSDELDAGTDPAGGGPEFRRGGDCAGADAFNILDPIGLLRYLFLAGAAPQCTDACDTNDNGAVNLADAVHMLTYLFLEGSPPRTPFGFCGLDPSPDTMECATTPQCK